MIISCMHSMLQRRLSYEQQMQVSAPYLATLSCKGGKWRHNCMQCKCRLPSSCGTLYRREVPTHFEGKCSITFSNRKSLQQEAGSRA